MLLTVVDSDRAWTARLNRESLDLGERAGDQDLLKILQDAFSGESELYSLTLEGDSTLIWKRIQGSTRITLTEIGLTRTNFSDAQTSLNQQLITENRSLKQANNELQRKQETLRRDNQKSLNMLEEFERERKDIEDKMYARFLPILNAKKAYIRELLAMSENGKKCNESDSEEVEVEEEDEDDEDEEKNTKRRRLDD